MGGVGGAGGKMAQVEGEGAPVVICQVDCVGVLLRHATITLYPPLSHSCMTCQSFSSCYQLHHVYIWLPGPAWRRLGSLAMIVTFILGRNTRPPL